MSFCGASICLAAASRDGPGVCCSGEFPSLRLPFMSALASPCRGVERLTLHGQNGITTAKSNDNGKLKVSLAQLLTCEWLLKPLEQHSSSLVAGSMLRHGSLQQLSSTLRHSVRAGTATSPLPKLLNTALRGFGDVASASAASAASPAASAHSLSHRFWDAARVYKQLSKVRIKQPKSA